MITAPHAPGGIGVAATAPQMLDYLGRLDTWLTERRAELDALDAQVMAEGRAQELTADMSLAMALWQAAKTRQEMLLSTWDSGRVGPQEFGSARRIDVGSPGNCWITGERAAIHGGVASRGRAAV